MATSTWRWLGFKVEQRRDLVLQRLQLVDAAGSAVPVTQISSSHAPASGSLSGLTSGAGEVRFSGVDVAQPGFYIQFDSTTAADIARALVTGTDPANAPKALIVCEGGAQWLPKLNYREIAYDANVQNLDGRTQDAAIGSVSLLMWPTGSSPRDKNINQTNSWVAMGGVTEIVSAAAVGGRTWRFPVGGQAWFAAPSNSGLELGSGDFTIESRIQTSKSGDIVLLDKYQTSQTWQFLLIGGRIGFFFGSNRTVGSTVVSDGTYHDIALERSGNLLRAYVDGRLDGEAAFALTIPDNGIPAAIGAQVTGRNAAYDFVGDMDYLRITRGLARNSSNTGYVPPLSMPGFIHEAAAYWPGGVNMTSSMGSPGVAPLGQGLQGMGESRISKLVDVECGGTGRIYGTVARKATPANIWLSRRVRLHRSIDGYLARETWSKADGSYEFREISTRYEWDVIAWDHEFQDFSTVANNQLAEVMP